MPRIPVPSRRDVLSSIGLGSLALAVDPTGIRLSFAQDKRVLRAAITSYVVLKTFDPPLATTLPEMMVLTAIFNSLVKFDTGMKIVPDLAESWENPTPNKWRFNLRRGVKFHDGSEMTADDVKFSLDRVRGEAFKSTYRKNLEPVTAVNIIDPYTIELITDAPYAPLLSFLTNARNGSQIVPRKIVEAVGDTEFGKNPVGTGPFKFVSFQPGQRVTLDANKNYFVEGQPKIDQLQIILIEQETSVISALLARDVDYSSGAPFADVASISKNPALTVNSQIGLNIRYVELNNTQPPFDDPHFRRAASMAFDRKILVDVVLFGDGAPANAMIPSALEWAYPATPFPENTFNPEAARAEMAKSKYQKGTKATVLTWGSSWWKRWAEVMVSQINETLGVNFAVEVIDSNAMGGRIIANNIQAAIWGFSGFVDPHEYTHQFLHSKGTRNYRGYKNAELDKLLDAARGELMREKRGALYRQASKLVAADSPVFTCFYSNQTNIWTKRLEGFQSLPYAAFGSQFAAVSIKG